MFVYIYIFNLCTENLKNKQIKYDVLVNDRDCWPNRHYIFPIVLLFYIEDGLLAETWRQRAKASSVSG